MAEEPIDRSIVTRVAWEPENDKPGLMRAVDEIVTGPLESFHLERLADGMYWMALYGKNGDRQVINIAAVNQRAKIIARTEDD